MIVYNNINKWTHIILPFSFFFVNLSYYVINFSGILYSLTSSSLISFIKLPCMWISFSLSLSYFLPPIIIFIYLPGTSCKDTEQAYYLIHVYYKYSRSNPNPNESIPETLVTFLLWTFSATIFTPLKGPAKIFYFLSLSAGIILKYG